MRKTSLMLTFGIILAAHVGMSTPAAANEENSRDDVCAEANGPCGGWNLFVALSPGSKAAALATTGKEFDTKGDCMDAGKAMVFGGGLYEEYLSWICAPAPKD